MANRNWGRVTDEGVLVLAPEVFDKGVPSLDDYREHGYHHVTYNEPEQRNGLVAHFARWRLDDDEIVRSWDYVSPSESDTVPKRYAKRKFILALAKMGYLERWDSFAERIELLPGLSVRRMFDESTWLQSDDEQFVAVLAEARKLFGDDVVDTALAESEDEEW